MNSNAHRWLLPLLFACFFAGVTAAIWFALDHVGVALRQAGWPFSSVLSLAMINAIGIGSILGPIVLGTTAHYLYLWIIGRGSRT